MTKTLTKLLFATLLVVPVVQFSNAEITGSGLQFAHCGGQLDFRLWLDSNNDGILNSGEPGLSNVQLELSRSDAAQLGVTLLVSDAAGAVNINQLCPGVYALNVDVTSVPSGMLFQSAYDSGQVLVGVDALFTVELASSSSQPSEIDVAFKQSACDLEIVSSCTMPGVKYGDIADYTCEKPISELSVVWNGDSAVRVMAHAGKLDKPVVADFNHVAPGQLVTVAGLEGSGSDLIWEIYEAGTDIKIGESSFHFSCSDHSMDGVEDCGAAAGDGKNDDKCTGGTCMNDWLFAGWIDKHNEIQCSTDSAMANATNCSLYPQDLYAARYRVKNNASSLSALTNVAESASIGVSANVPAMAGGQELDFLFFDQAQESVARRFSADSTVLGLGCSSESTIAVTVLEPPPPCDAVSVETHEVKHDAFKLRLTNSSSQDLVLVGYELSWPQANEILSEVKWDGAKLVDEDIDWEPLTVHDEAVFPVGPSERIIFINNTIETEFKFAEHVHDGPQNYEVEFKFDAGCSVSYSVSP